MRRTVLGLLLVVGCAPQAEEAAVYDLVEELAWAEITPAGAARAAGPQLELDPGSRVDYFLELPSDARLLVDEAAGVRFSWMTESGEESRPRALGRLGSLRLNSGEGGILRVRLAADPRADDVVAIASPRVMGPMSGAPPRAAARPGPGRPHPRPPLNVIVYLMDALRADRLGPYGYPRPTSERIDRFARDATVFERALAQSSWTKPTVASIFTGVWPPKHTANRRPDVLPAELSTLAEILTANGYRTAAFSTNPNITSEFGFEQGFATFVEVEGGGKRSARVHEELAAWLDRSDAEPFFLYAHTIDPHSPYAPPVALHERFAAEVSDRSVGANRTLDGLEAGRIEATDELIADIGALYDGEIAANDASFGRLLDLLGERDLAERTVIVLVSDHGEEFHDHGGWTHGKELYDESLAVPLVIRFPDRGRGQRISGAAQQIDILPTLLDYLGIELPRGVEGSSLLPALVTGEIAERPVFTYLHMSGPPRASVTAGGWKLIERYPRGEPVQRWLFDLESDPGEMRNLASENPVRAGWLGRLLAKKRAEPTLAEAVTTAIDPETERQLEALGYVQ